MNCPIPESKYLFAQQKQYDTIEKNLVYDSVRKYYITAYPWLTARSALPQNEKQALQWLHSHEKSFSRDPALGEDLDGQIQSMVERGVARVLSKQEMDSWRGHFHYLAIIGVRGKYMFRCF